MVASSCIVGSTSPMQKGVRRCYCFCWPKTRMPQRPGKALGHRYSRI
jgi:hypothetical protein